MHWPAVIIITWSPTCCFFALTRNVDVVKGDRRSAFVFISFKRFKHISSQYTYTKVLPLEDRLSRWGNSVAATVWGRVINEKRELKPSLTPKGNDFQLWTVRYDYSLISFHSYKCNWLNNSSQLAKLEANPHLCSACFFQAGSLVINDTHSMYIGQNCWDLISMIAWACLLEGMLLLLAL